MEKLLHGLTNIKPIQYRLHFKQAENLKSPDMKDEG